MDTERRDAVFAAIAAPVRRDMLRLMAGQEVGVTEIAPAFDLSLSAASQHLSVLRDADLVAVRKDGRQRLYRTTPDPLRSVADWVAHYVPFWTDRIGSLADHLEKKHGNSDPI
ncbi:MAG: ArsR/SmtB family transcription factor [Fimbriimonas sp.]